MIPIVASSADPVGAGLVAGLAQPGRKITGLNNLISELVGKRLELLKEVIPELSHGAVLWTRPPGVGAWRKAQVAAESLGVQPQAAEVQRSRRFRARIRSYKKRTCSGSNHATEPHRNT